MYSHQNHHTCLFSLSERLKADSTIRVNRSLKEVKGFIRSLIFLNASHIQYALIENPTIYVSFIKQFWRTTTAGTSANREVELTPTIDGQVKTITEASLRRHLKLEDNGGVTTLSNSEIFNAPGTSPSRITSLPSLSPQHTPVSTPSTSQPLNSQPTPDAEEVVPMPHESPLHSFHSLGHDKGSLSLNELTDLCTSLSKKVEVKKLELIVKASKSRRRVRVVESDDEEDFEDPSKHGRSLIEELDMDAGISLIPPHAVDEGRNDDTQIYDLPAEQLEVFSAATALVDAAKRRRSVKTA
ncbi:hypothetical protein Tco_1164380 [Tanacetum coccineum]